MATPQQVAPIEPHKTAVAQAVADAIAPAAAPAAAQPELPFEKAKPAENPRNQAYREIAKASDLRQVAEANETMPVTDDDGNPVTLAAEPAPAPEPDPESEEAAPEPVAAQPAAAPEPAPEPAPAPAAVAAPTAVAPVDPKAIDPNADYPVTVDGQRILVKGAKIIDAGFRTFQKETAADYRLQLATNMLDAAKQTVAQAQPPAPAGAPAAAPAPGAGQASDAELAQALQFGTSEQAAAALATLRRRDPSAITTDGLQQFMRQQLPDMVNAQLSFRDAANFAKTEYGDLLADPYLKELFLLKEDQLRKAGDARPPAELYKAIGDDIRTHFNKPKAASPTPAPQTMAQRTAAKAAAPAAPRLAAARLDSGDPTQKPKTTQDIIAQMRVKRGQGTLNRI